MSGVTGTIGYSDEGKWEDVLAQRTDGKGSTTGRTGSLVRVSGSTNMCSHACSTAEVAFMKFDEDMVFKVRLNARLIDATAYRKE